jgi:two-component system, OmpR family, response regulator
MTLRVFMVEDSAALRAHLIDRLATAADVAVVGVASTESQAKHWIESNPGQWDVALVDLFLRDGTGAGVVEHCRTLYPGQVVLVMTNHVKDERLLQDCQRLGVDAVYHKATELDGLVAYCARRATQSPVPVHIH